MGDALARGADTIVTQGATQTNHGRQTAAACRLIGGLECHILLERRATVNDFGEDYEKQGNVLINELYGAQLSFHETGQDMNALGQKYTDELSSNGKKAYFRAVVPMPLVLWVMLTVRRKFSIRLIRCA